MPKQILKKSSLPEIRRENALKNPFFVLFGGCRWPVGGDDGRGWKNVVENFGQVWEGESLDILEIVALDIFQDSQDCFVFLTSRHSEHPCRWGGLQRCSWSGAGVFSFPSNPVFQVEFWFLFFPPENQFSKKEKTGFSSENRLFSPATAPARIKTFKNTKYLQILAGVTPDTRAMYYVYRIL